MKQYPFFFRKFQIQTQIIASSLKCSSKFEQNKQQINRKLNPQRFLPFQQTSRTESLHICSLDLLMPDFRQTHFYEDQFNLEQDDETKSTQNLEETIQKPYKIGIILTILGTFLAYRILYANFPHKNCVVDQLHELTFNLNRWISENSAKLFLGLGQLIMDINITCMTVYWQFFGQTRIINVKNFRYPATTMVFYVIRRQILNLSTMPYTSYVIWFSPGFFSLTAAYDHTSDYFYSGHTGTLIIILMQLQRLGLPKWTHVWLTISTLYIVFMLVVSRVHYTIDVFGGLFFAGFCFWMVDNYTWVFDQVMNAPYRVVHIVKQKVQKKLVGDTEAV